MKKLIFICLVMATASVVSAQKVTRYCVVQGMPKGFNAKMALSIDFAEKGFKDPQTIQALKNVEKIPNIVDGMNYLSSMGWTLVAAYSIPQPNVVTMYQYFFKKEFDASELTGEIEMKK